MKKNTVNGWKILSLFLALIIVAGVIVGVVFWDRGNIVFNPIEQEQPNDDDNGGAIIGEGESNGIALLSAKIAVADYDEYGVSSMAETAYTVTAYVYPENAFNKALDWSVGFNDTDSWSEGKTVTDYVTVTPESDGSNTAIIECWQAFGTQIEVVATSRSNPEVSGSVTCDYFARVESVDVTMDDSDSFRIGAANSHEVTFTPVLSVGTTGGSVIFSNLRVALANGFTDELDQLVGSLRQYYEYRDADSLQIDSQNGGNFSFKINTARFYECFCEPNGSTEPDSETFHGWVCKVIQSYEGTHAVLSVDYSLSSGDSVYSSGTVKVDLKFDRSYYFIGVTNINIDNNVITF